MRGFTRNCCFGYFGSGGDSTSCQIARWLRQVWWRGVLIKSILYGILFWVWVHIVAEITIAVKGM